MPINVQACLISALLLLAPIKAFAGAQISVEFPTDQTEVNIRLVRAGRLFLVPVQISGQDCGLFVLDTGASHLLMDSGLAQRLKLNRVAQGSTRAVGGQKAMEVFAVPALAVEGVAIHDTFVGAPDLGPFRKEIGTDRINGIIGMEFLRRMPFKLDPRGASLTLYHPDKFSPPAQAERRPLRMLPILPAVKVTLEKELSGWFILDTGSNKTLSLHSNFARVHRDWLSHHPWQSQLTVGLAGSHSSRLINLKQIDYFGTQATNVAADYSFEEGGVAASSGAGAMGMELLDRWEMTFHIQNEAIWVKRYPNAIPDEWEAADFDSRAPDITGMTPLMRAATIGEVDFIRRFLAAGADANAKDSGGMTALHYAALAGQPEAVQVLIQAKVDVNSKTPEGQTSLIFAAKNGISSVVDQFITAGADLEADDVFGRTALVIAAERGHANAVAKLLKSGAKLNHISKASGSAQNAAASYGHAEVMKLLLDAGADAAAVDPFQNVPVLYMAARGGSAEVVRLLISRGAAVNALNPAGQTALFVAAHSGKREIVDLLLQAGTDRNIRDKDGLIAFDYATARGDFDCMAALYYGQPTKDAGSPTSSPTRPATSANSATSTNSSPPRQP